MRADIWSGGPQRVGQASRLSPLSRNFLHQLVSPSQEGNRTPQCGVEKLETGATPVLLHGFSLKVANSGRLPHTQPTVNFHDALIAGKSVPAVRLASGQKVTALVCCTLFGAVSFPMTLK